MSVSPEEKKRYFQETAIALRREGFRIEPSIGGRLGVWLEDHPICEVDQIGGITYRSDNIPTPEYVAAKDKAYKIVSTTAEYMRQMEQAPSLKASGLEDRYKVLADFNGTVLAGTQGKYGMEFVTWDWDYDRKGVSHGHYFIPELLDEFLRVRQIHRAEGLVSQFLHAQQDDAAVGIGKGGVGLPNALGQAAEGLLGLDAVVLPVLLYLGKINHAAPPSPVR